MTSRSLFDLHPDVRDMAAAHIAACKAQGIDLLVTSTYRSTAEQNALYAQGRTKPGKKVTNAKGGQSFHNHRLAYDVVPLRNGKPVWGTTGEDGKLWQRVGELGEAAGLEWAGRWTKFKEFPHFQYTGGKPLSYFQNGGRLEA
jgi:peptidoglycan L-alanyl-D-glutamate endopeptidase CwlK